MTVLRAAVGYRGDVQVRDASEDDLVAIVELYALFGALDAGSELDTAAGSTDLGTYRAAFAVVEAHPDHRLLVAEEDGRVIGTLHFTELQYVAYRGGKVALVEVVYVHPDARGRGAGEAMMRWAIDEARRRGCFRLQLTTNKRRSRARAFYQRLGFVASHEGMKLTL